MYLALLLLTATLAAEPVQVTLTAPTTSIAPGETTQACFRFAADEGWEIHEAPKVVWHLPEGIQAGPQAWMPPTLFVPLTASRDTHEGRIVLGTDVSWAACSSTECMPGTAHLKLALLIDGSTSSRIDVGGLGAEALQLRNVLLLALLGGMLLNLMPCVLPVMSLKVLQIVRMSGESWFWRVWHSIGFGVGVLVTFWVLGGAVVALREVGVSVGWGFQLQEPFFVVGLVVLLWAMTLWLFGVWSTSGIAVEMPHKSGWWSSLWSGVLATVLATPCTGPLLGSALGLTLLLDVNAAMLIFTAVGVGMALPYMVLSILGSARWLPHPGRWMVTLKQLMGFFMLATVLWLLWVLDGQVKGLTVPGVVGALVGMSFGLWVYGTWGGLERKRGVRWLGRFIGFVLFAAAAYVLVDEVEVGKRMEQRREGWERFSQHRLHQLLEQGKPVFVNVTARWCLVCQANEATLESDAVQAAFKSHGVALLQANWTDGDPEITAYLHSLGRNGVPVHALYLDGKVELLPEILTPGMVIDALH